MSLDEKINKKRIPRRSFLKKTVSTLGTLALAAYIGLGLGACNNPSGTTPPSPTPGGSGNLTGRVVGLLKGGIITEGTVTLGARDNYNRFTTAATASIRPDGTFEMLDIKNPARKNRIMLESSQGIKRETNIALAEGDNNAEINMVEADGISGFEYNDYLTIIRDGQRMDQSKPYQAYFYDRSIWAVVGSDWQVVGTAPASYTTDALTKVIDVLQNDLTIMSKGNYAYNGLLLESQGDPGPGKPPTSTDPKSGWLVIFLRVDNAFKTSNSEDNYIVTSAYMSIPYLSHVSTLITGRTPYSQDICEWAGYADLLQKSNHSIFADTDNGYGATPYPSDFDKDYAAVIKYNRLPGNGSIIMDDILDYDPVASTGSGVKVTYVRSLAPASRSAFDNPFFQSPLLEDSLSHREMRKEQGQRISERSKKEVKRHQ